MSEFKQIVQKMSGFNLIDGHFELEEAKELTSAFIDKKINFHELKNFSHRVRFGKDDENSINKIEELKKTKEHIIKHLNQTENPEQKLRINAIMTIEYIAE